jgi:hypothetical protein
MMMIGVLTAGKDSVAWPGSGYSVSLAELGKQFINPPMSS